MAKTASEHVHHSRPCSEKLEVNSKHIVLHIKTYTLATCHRGRGCPVDRVINLHIEDMKGINTGPDNDNESTSGSETNVAFGGSEAVGHPSKLILATKSS